jgi:uncharacterized protein YkwD
MAVNRRTFLRIIGASTSIGGTIALPGCAETVDDTPTSTPREIASFDAVHGDAFSKIEPVEMAIHDATNEFRENKNRSTYIYNSKLTSISRNHSRNMAVNGFFSHTDHKGRGVGDRADVYGYNGVVSENLIRFNVPESWDSRQAGDHAVSGWKDSAGHRMTLLDETKVETGVGAYLTQQEELFVTAMYGSKDERITNKSLDRP